MASDFQTNSVRAAFEPTTLSLPIDSLQPLHPVGKETKKTQKYLQIAASIREIGLVEPPVVAPARSKDGRYLLLDGHLRGEILRDIGETSVVCLISTDDEAFTYNNRISRPAIIQEHKMILKAIYRGASEERIAAALNVNIAAIRQK